jgi:predicted ATPase
MALTRITIDGFKSIKHADIELRPLNILIGANGSGKTNFISLFRLFNQMVDGNFQFAIARGGGAENFLYYGSKTTKEIVIRLYFGQNEYICVWAPTVDNKLARTREAYSVYDSFGENARITQVDPDSIPEANMPAGLTKLPLAQYALNAFVKWTLYHFHDTSDTASLKKPCAINDNMFLRQDAGNLPAFLFLLQTKYPTSYQSIVETVRLVAPFFKDFILRPMALNENMIQLEWREKESDFPFLAHHFSDGTLRFICLAAVLLQPNPPSTILIDEPELGLHPYAISLLAELMKKAAINKQLIVSTQSVPLVNQFQPEDIIVMERENGESIFKRLSAGDMRGWLEDYGLGDLWEKNLLGGRP